MNKNVTLEVVAYILDLYPSAYNIKKDLLDKHITAAYPLHVACYNMNCPNEVIQLLLTHHYQFTTSLDQMDSDWDQLTHICYMDFDYGEIGDLMEGEYHGATPLHLYLSRTSNFDINIVKQLVANPGMLLLSDRDSKCTPIHILVHNEHMGDMFGVIQYLVETNPSTLLAKDVYDQTPLDVACKNDSVTTKIIELFLEACPSSIHQRNNGNALPIHSLCDAVEYHETRMDDEVAIEILLLLIEANPNSVSETDEDEELPLHFAASNKSQDFCKILVDAYPESVRRENSFGYLPFHSACCNGRLETVEYLLGLYPESLHISDNKGNLPIHCASNSPGENTAKIINFLLLHDPECLSKPVVSDFGSEDDGHLPLHVICDAWGADESLVTELLFDLYPEAILKRNERGQLPFDVLRSKDDGLSIDVETERPDDEEARKRNREVLSFLSTQMGYAYKAQDGKALMRPDHTCSLPLHYAVRTRAPLGSIKLLVKGYPNSIRMPDRSGMYPLDIAIQFSPLGVVKYLAELTPLRLNRCDRNKNFPLHHACREGKCEVILYLLDRPMSSAAVSERNIDGRLPIHLFCEHVRCCHGYDPPEYTETIWRLLSAYPETVLNW